MWVRCSESYTWPPPALLKLSRSLLPTSMSAAPELPWALLAWAAAPPAETTHSAAWRCGTSRKVCSPTPSLLSARRSTCTVHQQVHWDISVVAQKRVYEEVNWVVSSQEVICTCITPRVKGSLGAFMGHRLPEDQLGHQELAHNAALLMLPGPRQIPAEAVQAQQQQVQVADSQHGPPALAACTGGCAPQCQLHGMSTLLQGVDFGQRQHTCCAVSNHTNQRRSHCTQVLCQGKLSYHLCATTCRREQNMACRLPTRWLGVAVLADFRARRWPTWDAEALRAKFLGEGRNDTGISHPGPHPAVWRESTGGMLPAIRSALRTS